MAIRARIRPVEGNPTSYSTGGASFTRKAWVDVSGSLEAYVRSNPMFEFELLPSAPRAATAARQTPIEAPPQIVVEVPAAEPAPVEPAPPPPALEEVAPVVADAPRRRGRPRKDA